MRKQTVALILVVTILAIFIPTALKLYTYPPSEKTQEKPPFSSVKFYYAPPCGCCEKYLAKLRQYFAVDVTVLDPQKLQELKKRLGVPERLWSCHTIVVEGGLFIEGHVPISAFTALAKGGVRGLALPHAETDSTTWEGPGYYLVYENGTIWRVYS